MEISGIIKEEAEGGEIPGVFEPKTTVHKQDISGKPEDIQKDLALLANQLNPSEAVKTEPLQPNSANATPVPSQAVPEKFKNPDGSVNVDRIEQSTVNAEEAYAKYRAKELELQKKMNEVSRLSRSVPQTPGIPAQPEAPQPDSFEAQIERDIQTLGAGKVLAKLFDAAKQAAKNEALADIQMIRQEAELDKRQRELDVIAKNDSWVLSEEGIETLGKIRSEKPWLNQSPTPWTEAYKDRKSVV